MLKTIALFATLITNLLLAGPILNKTDAVIETQEVSTNTQFKAFTGKIVGDNVRMRSVADLDGMIISELAKNEYVVVDGEKEGFFAIRVPKELKAYIFRGFIIDNVIEGERVHFRLAPNKEALILGHYNTGQHVDGTICENNTKWLQIEVPDTVRFYVAKEFVERVGGVDFKSIHDQRKKDVVQMFESTRLLAQSELNKNFHEIGIERVKQDFQTIIEKYTDFPEIVSKAKKALAKVQENYLCRKITFLENKASQKTEKDRPENIYDALRNTNEDISQTDRMKIWEPIEQACYLKWSSMHYAKTMDDFYRDQKLKSQRISGIVEAYKEPVQNKPGDFVVKNHDIVTAYIYSTHINLCEYEGKWVNLMVAPRSNNNFAFPAYCVLDVE